MRGWSHPTSSSMDDGKITIMQKYYENDPGQPRDYVCWEETGHGMQDFLHGLANSCDVYFYKIGGGYGTEVPEGPGRLAAGRVCPRARIWPPDRHRTAR